jgi:hypothetical protein
LFVGETTLINITTNTLQFSSRWNNDTGHEERLLFYNNIVVLLATTQGITPTPAD